MSAILNVERASSDTAAISILDVIKQQEFAQWFKDRETWTAWFAFLAALFALPMTPEQLTIYRECTGRQAPPTQPHRTATLVCGRRSGKSFVLALISTFLSVFRDWRPFLQPGERAVVMIIAADRGQANQILSYIRGFFQNVPMLTKLLERETADALDLTNSVRIQINSASYSRVRGYAVCVCLADELAFWSVDDGAANPDHEILRALRPAMAQFGEQSVLLLASSPYGKSGVLYESHRDHFAHDGDPVLVWQAATRTMNPTIPQSEVDKAIARDPFEASSEWLANFRDDVSSLLSADQLDASTDGTPERKYNAGFSYCAFLDAASGSGSDSISMAIAHMVGETAILDLVRDVPPPFAPSAVAADFSKILHGYGVATIRADRWGGEWVAEVFKSHDIDVDTAEQTKTDIYGNLVPLLNSGRIRLLDNARLRHQFLGLERRTTRNGRAIIDHAKSANAHDDLCNSAAGALCFAIERGAVRPMRFMPSHAIDAHDPFASAEDNMLAAARQERRFRFSGHGNSPTLHESEPQQAFAIND